MITLVRLLRYTSYALLMTIILAAGLATYLAWLQPPFYFPKPTGQYAVGKRDYHWIDTTRKETLSNDPAHPHRELMATIWYPAKGILPAQPTTPYIPYVANYFKKNRPFFWLVSYARPAYTYAQPDASLATNSTRYPIILYTHGSGMGRADSNTAHCEELASHGYVVVGISHPYESNIVQFPDGRIVVHDPAIAKKEGRSYLEVSGAEHKSLSFMEKREQLDGEYIERRIADTQFVLDQLELLNKNPDSIFFNRLALDDSGIFGQSFGSATAMQLCRRDKRVKVCVGFDGSLFGPNAAEPLDKPVMFMLAGNTVAMFDNLTPRDRVRLNISTPQEEQMVRDRFLLAFQKLMKGPDSYTFVVKDAGHIDFTDSALLKESSWLAGFLIRRVATFPPGSINGLRATKIVNDYLVNFFDQYLKDQSSDLLDGRDTGYAEVERRYGK